MEKHLYIGTLPKGSGPKPEVRKLPKNRAFISWVDSHKDYCLTIIVDPSTNESPVVKGDRAGALAIYRDKPIWYVPVFDPDEKGWSFFYTKAPKNEEEKKSTEIRAVVRLGDRFPQTSFGRDKGICKSMTNHYSITWKNDRFILKFLFETESKKR